MNKFLLRFDEERNDIIWGRDYDQSLTEPGPEIPPDVLLLQSDGALKAAFDNLVGSNKANITGIVRDENPPAEGITTVSISETDDLVVAWVDNNTIHMYSSRGTMVAPSSLSSLFEDYNLLTDISGLSCWDTRSVTDMSRAFYNASELINVSALANWDTSSVTDMSYTFCNNMELDNISALSDWNTGSVTNMAGMFEFTYNLSDISALTNWNTSNVVNMNEMFYNSGISNISALTNWNTSNVTDMGLMFAETGISDISPLINWNTGSVTKMNSMFVGTSITSLDSLSNWNTSSVTDMSNMFESLQISSTTPIANWNTSNVVNMSYMFNGVPFGTDRVLDISEWDLSSITNAAYAFNDVITKIICTEEAEAKIRSFGLSNVGLSDSVVFERPADIKVLYDAENNINNLESSLQIAAMNGSNTVYLSYDNYFELEQQRLGEGGNYAVADNMADGTGDYAIGYKDYDTGTMLYSLIDNICIDIADYSEYNYISIKFPYRWTSVSNEELSKVPNLIINKEKIIYRTNAISQTSNGDDENGKFEIFYPINNAETMTDSYYLSPYTSTQNEITSTEQTRAFFITLVSIMIGTIQLVKSIGSDTASIQ